MSGILGDAGPLSLQVWRRNLEVYLVTWRTACVSVVEPIFNFLAFGLGVGTLTREVAVDGAAVPYEAWVAPGIVAMSIMFQSFFDCLYGSYIRMYYQRTFDAITATPASLDDVVVGEALWGATRALIGSLTTLLVLLAFGHARTPAAAAVPLLAVCGGLLFGSAGLCFTGIVRNIDSINYPLHLVGVPMYLFGGLFFPVDAMPGWARAIAAANPVHHLAEALRECCGGGLGPRVWLTALGLLAASVPLLALALRLMRRRLVK
ncbi:MAG: ABC transporter permease [Planctomycetes bacterium]|nr:ABC transporter permease [Planctomycetota bacterium]